MRLWGFQGDEPVIEDVKEDEKDDDEDDDDDDDDEDDKEDGAQGSFFFLFKLRIWMFYFVLSLVIFVASCVGSILSSGHIGCLTWFRAKYYIEMFLFMFPGG